MLSLRKAWIAFANANGSLKNEVEEGRAGRACKIQRIRVYRGVEGA